jgi:DNA-binding IscR family transcriptional regulator
MYECNATAKLCKLGPKCLILATFSEAERKMQEILARVNLQDVVNHSAAEAQWTTHTAPVTPKVLAQSTEGK